MPWKRATDPEEIAQFAASDQLSEFGRAFRAAGFAGDFVGFFGEYDERYIGGEEPTYFPRATATPEFAQWVRDNSVVVYGRDLGFMAADYFLTIGGRLVAESHPRPGTFDRVMSTISDLAVPAILTAGLAAGVGSLVQAAGASGALATGLTRAGASTLFAVGAGAPLDVERIATSALVAGGGAAAMDWIGSAGAVPDVFPTDLEVPDLGAGDPLAGGTLDPFASPDVVQITDLGIDTSSVVAAATGPGVSLADVVDLGTMSDTVDLGDVAAVDTSGDVVDLGAGGANMGDDLSGSILWDPGTSTADDMTAWNWDPNSVDNAGDVVDVVDPGSIEAPPDPIMDPIFAPPPILEPTPPPAPIPTVIVAPGSGTPGVGFDTIIKQATGAALAAISVVRAWEQRKLPVNQTARQTDPRGNQQTVTRDGVIVTRAPSGAVSTSRPPVGEPRMSVDGTMVMNNGDGTYTRVNPDGSRETVRYPTTGAGAGAGAAGGLGVPPELLYVGIGALVLFALRK